MTFESSAAPLASLAASGAFGYVAPQLTSRMRPAAGAWLLTLGAAASAACATVILLMVAAPFLGRTDAVGDALHLRLAVLPEGTPGGRAVGATSLGVLILLASRGVRRWWRMRSATRAAAAVAARLSPTPGGLVVVIDEVPDAFALAGRAPRVVVTSALLRSLAPEQRRAVLAHEFAHLRHGHHRHLRAVTMAAAVNPFLRRLPAASALAVERWADEVSARATSRSATASALAHLARASPAAEAGTTVRTVCDAITLRVNALHEGTPPPRVVSYAALCFLVLVAVVTAALTMGHTLDVLALAMRATHHVHLRR